MTVHRLKTHPEPFSAVRAGDKIHEFRKDDRNFQVGDILILEEYDPATSTYTGFQTCRRIAYKGTGFGIPEGFCCLSIKPILPPPLSLVVPAEEAAEREVYRERMRTNAGKVALMALTDTLEQQLAEADTYKAEIKRKSLDRKMIYQEVDGYYVYQRGTTGGFLSAFELMTLSVILDEMNAEWDAQVRADSRIDGPSRTDDRPFDEMPNMNPRFPE